MSLLLCLLTFVVGSHAQLLQCIGCEQGHYLDAVNETHGSCRRCPVDSTTPPGFNAFDRLHCVCDPGHTPVEGVCADCVAGAYKPVLGNHTCTECPSNAHTNGTGKAALADCLCEAGYELGVYRASPSAVSMYGDAIKLALGGYSVITSPDFHPFRISTHDAWSRDHDYSEMSVNGAEVTIFVPDNFVGQLYYYCDNHGPMHGPVELDPALVQCEECPAGTFKGSIGDEVCATCPADHFCPGNTVVPEACPANSVAAAGSDALNDCACEPGFYADRGVNGGSLTCELCPVGEFNENFNVSACEQCPANTFNPELGAADVALCQDCDPNAASPPGSSAAVQCKCNLGYAGEPGQACVACAPGTFRSNELEYFCTSCAAGTYNELDAADSSGLCLSCHANTNSLAGSGSVWDCVCVPGYHHAPVNPPDTAYSCVACQPGSYQTQLNSSACVQCPAGTASTTTAAAVPSVCEVCADGSYSLQPGTVYCDACAGSTYQNTSVPGVTALPCTPCPANSAHNLTGQTDVEVCRCAAGFVVRGEGSDLYRCETCEPGHFCPGDGVQTLCALNHFADAGASKCTECAALSHGGQIVSREQCLCVPGAEGTFHDGCSACDLGKFQSQTASHVSCEPCSVGFFADDTGFSQCTKCPGNSSTFAVGSDAVTDCVCVARFFGPLGGPCSLCPAGSFCAGGTAATPCRLHSTSPRGSAGEAECDCLASYYSEEEDSTCQKCPAGSFCPGDLARIPCSQGSDSKPGSAVIESCICDGGLWRGCVIAADGLAYNESGRCEIDYTVPCVECGADAVCVNNTLQHCPPHSSAPAGTSDPFACDCFPGFHRVLVH